MNILNFLIPFLLTYSITKIFLPYFRKYVSALPTERGFHKYIKPSGGGIIFSLIFLLFSLSNDFYYLSLISIPLSIIGLIDDKFNISLKYRLFVQVIVVTLIILYLRNNDLTFISSLIDNNFLIFFILLFMGVSIINFINFMDGIDGLVGGGFIFIFLSIIGNTDYLIPLVGALLGFIILNWQPAKIFMGDAGSLFIGGIFVGVTFKSNTNIEFLKVLLLSTPLIIDPLTTLIKRIYYKHPFWKAHNLHLYQRLVSAGLSHSKVSSIYILAILANCFVYRFSNLLNLFLTSVVIVIIGAILDYKIAVCFKKNNNLK